MRKEKWLRAMLVFAFVMLSAPSFALDPAAQPFLSPGPGAYAAKIITLPGQPYFPYYVIYGRFESTPESAQSCNVLAEQAVHLQATYYGRDAGDLHSWCRDFGESCAFRCFVKLEELSDLLNSFPYAVLGLKNFRFFLEQAGGARSPDLDLLGGAAQPKAHPPWQDVVGRWSDGDGDDVPDFADNCQDVSNNDQADADGDGTGDACASAVKMADTPGPQSRVF
jgi:hypothetical protein